MVRGPSPVHEELTNVNTASALALGPKARRRRMRTPHLAEALASTLAGPFHHHRRAGGPYKPRRWRLTITLALPQKRRRRRDLKRPFPLPNALLPRLSRLRRLPGLGRRVRKLHSLRRPFADLGDWSVASSFPKAGRGLAVGLPKMRGLGGHHPSLARPRLLRPNGAEAVWLRGLMLVRRLLHRDLPSFKQLAACAARLRYRCDTCFGGRRSSLCGLPLRLRRLGHGLACGLACGGLASLRSSNSSPGCCGNRLLQARSLVLILFGNPSSKRIHNIRRHDVMLVRVPTLTQQPQQLRQQLSGGRLVHRCGGSSQASIDLLGQPGDHGSHVLHAHEMLTIELRLELLVLEPGTA
mmetsp:Transcript_3941/g.9284  ORF Transcript_3941/g.9284 Transcript_3941/m.9284 type:complete len:353 (-) Transcript_3941:398-1456(-)